MKKDLGSNKQNISNDIKTNKVDLKLKDLYISETFTDQTLNFRMGHVKFVGSYELESLIFFPNKDPAQMLTVAYTTH